MRKRICLAALISLGACKKKDDDKSTNPAAGTAEEKTAANAPEAIKQPLGVLNVALTSMKSIGTNLSAVGAGLHLDDGFSEADCSEHATPLARTGDPSEDIANNNELRIQNPRAPLQHFYCMMQKDTGSPDSFLGAVSSIKDMLCILGKDLNFDGVEREITRTKADLLECFKDYTQEEQDEMIGEIGDSVTAKITSSRPAAFGDQDAWDGSVSFVVGSETIRILLKDSDDVVAIAINNGSGRPESIDGFVTSVNKSTGEVNFEAKFQRIRTANGTGNSGWTRHARAYVKGTMDADLKFSAVSQIGGIYSNLFQKNNAQAGDPIMSGNIWAVTGGDSQGVKSTSYQLNCTYDADTNTQTCSDPNSIANWTATAGSGACNGSLTDTACSSVTALEMTTDSDIQFIMDTEHPSFEKTEDWMTALKAPSFSSMTYSISQ